jgi:serine/threonine-protein kinase
MIGQILLGKFKVLRQLDEGGMSKIYLARQIDQPRDAVIKMLKEHLRSQAKPVEHFRREIFIMTRLKHPNCVEVYDSTTRDLRGPILAMEYLRGTDLNLLLQRDGRLTPERAGRILGQLCDVLHYTHESGILHRDIKPGNVMIQHPGTPQETVKLMDFGLAKISRTLYISPEEIGDANSFSASGTPEYISPEMVRGQEMDARSDLYSVGVMLYEMLAGRRPFHHASVEELMVAHAREAPPSFAEIGLDGLVPYAIEKVVMGCLAKSPDQRPRSAWDLAEAYERALGRRILPKRHEIVRSQQPTAVIRRPPSSQSLHARPPMEVDRNAVRQTMTANMPEAMALVKIKGFIYDLGGEMVESVPGLVKLRLQDRQEPSSGGGFFDWFTGGNSRQPSALQTAAGTDIELHMERRQGPGGPLTITLTMKPVGGLATAEWKKRSNDIGRDLQAYLMGR